MFAHKRRPKTSPVPLDPGCSITRIRARNSAIYRWSYFRFPPITHLELNCSGRGGVLLQTPGQELKKIKEMSASKASIKAKKTRGLASPGIAKAPTGIQGLDEIT